MPPIDDRDPFLDVLSGQEPQASPPRRSGPGIPPAVAAMGALRRARRIRTIVGAVAMASVGAAVVGVVAAVDGALPAGLVVAAVVTCTAAYAAASLSDEPGGTDVEEPLRAGPRRRAPNASSP